MMSVAQGNRKVTVKLCLHQYEKLHPFLSHRHGSLKMIWTRRTPIGMKTWKGDTHKVSTLNPLELEATKEN